MSRAVVDASVLMDMFFSHRPRHTSAAQLAQEMITRRITCVLPMHGQFEMMSAINSEIRTHGSLKQYGNAAIGQKNALAMDLVPIDLAFVDKYAIGLSKDLRAGDMIYLAIAFVDKLPLITADQRLRSAAIAKGAKVYSAEEFVAELTK